MIKFFRHIRKTLISENKMGKYFKYAIGEILLVMIGILLALQVSTWNNQRLEVKREQTILKNLQADFKANINNVDKTYNSFLEAYKASANLLEIISSKDTINGSTIEHLLDEIINKTMSLDINTGSIKEMLNTGSINLIRDTNLKKQLSNWSYFETDTQDDIVIYRNYLFDFFIPSLTNKSLLRNMEVPDFFEEDLKLQIISKSSFKIDYNKSIRTIEFENELYNNTLNYMYTLNSYKVFKNYLTETLKLIESNLND